MGLFNPRKKIIMKQIIRFIKNIFKIKHKITDYNSNYLYKLVKKTQVGDKVIVLADGIYKLRKNGKFVVSIDTGKKREIVRVTRLR
jgi:hypothetical protein